METTVAITTTHKENTHREPKNRLSAHSTASADEKLLELRARVGEGINTAIREQIQPREHEHGQGKITRHQDDRFIGHLKEQSNQNRARELTFNQPDGIP